MNPAMKKLLNITLRIIIIFDILIAVGLLATYVWLAASYSNVVDGGLIVLFAAPYFIIPAALVLIDGYVLYRQRNGSRRLFTYYAVTRSVILLGALYYLYQYVGYDSTVDGYNAMYAFLLIAVAVIFGLIGLIIYRSTRGTWQVILLSIVALVAIAGSVYLHIAAHQSNTDTAGGLVSGSRRDNQTARDFQLLSQDVANYALNQNHFPVTLSQAISAPNSLVGEVKENTSSRLGRYDYRYNDKTGEYKLCATFATVTENGDTGYIKAYSHGKGYQCFSFNINEPGS